MVLFNYSSLKDSGTSGSKNMKAHIGATPLAMFVKKSDTELSKNSIFKPPNIKFNLLKQLIIS